MALGGALAVLFGCGRPDPEESPPGPVAVSSIPADERGAAAGPAYARPDDPPDPHGPDCTICHQPGNAHQAPRGGWLPTCSTAGCHPKAWTETVSHRVDPEVFKDCTNCHRPHVWKAVGADCRSCHGPGGTTAAMAAMATTSATSGFLHDRHAALKCAACHAAGEGHATIPSLSPADCQACHHSPAGAAACGACHPSSELAGSRRVNVSMTLSRATPARRHQLPFDHARHAGMACTACHIGALDGPVNVDCAACHGAHREADLTCRTCHAAPPPGVHPIRVHETGCAGSACHDTPALTALPRPRELCLACHGAQVDHQPGKACATCHLMSIGHGAGS